MTVIGVNWAGNNSSPTLTRVGVDGTNGTYTGPASGGAAFDSFGTWGGMKRVNLWDDGTVTSEWGTRCYTDTDTGTLGQVMVKIPRFLYWIDRGYYGSGYARFMIGSPSDVGTIVARAFDWPHVLTKADTHPLFVVDGEYVDYAYVGAFEGYYGLVDYVMESKAGVTPMTAETNALMRTYAENRGAGWELMNYQALSALQLLYMVEYASLNSQASVGNGLTNTTLNVTGGTGTTGTDRGNASYGTTGNSTTAMSYRGVENLWGNMLTLVDGINLKTSTRVAWIAPQSRNRPTYYQWDTFASPYVAHDAVVNAGTAGYFVSAMADPNWGFLPKALSGSATTYYCDQVSTTAGDLILSQGGQYDTGTPAGIFAQNYQLSSVLSGGRLQYIPAPTG